MIEEILKEHEVERNWYEPDMVMIHDGNYPLLKRYIEGKKIRFPAERIIAFTDHFSPPCTGEHARYVEEFEKFVEEHGIKYHRYEGISHELMFRYVEEGMFVVGLDSHSTAYGAKGALSIGVGAMDMASILLKGSMWLEKPSTYRLILQAHTPHVFDIGLWLMHMRKLYRGKWLEIEGEYDFEDRKIISTMIADTGAIAGLFVEPSLEYYQYKRGKWFEERELRDRMDVFRLSTDISAIFNYYTDYYVDPQMDLIDMDFEEDSKVDQVFIGSCMGGRLRDLQIASEILRGRRVKSRLLVSPASMEIYREALHRGIIEDLVDSGAVILNPGCGVCAGLMGRMSEGEVGVYTTLRTSEARHGGYVYAASPIVAAVSAIIGRIPKMEDIYDYW